MYCDAHDINTSSALSADAMFNVNPDSVICLIPNSSQTAKEKANGDASHAQKKDTLFPNGSEILRMFPKSLHSPFSTRSTSGKNRKDSAASSTVSLRSGTNESHVSDFMGTGSDRHKRKKSEEDKVGVKKRLYKSMTLKPRSLKSPFAKQDKNRKSFHESFGQDLEQTSAAESSLYDQEPSTSGNIRNMLSSTQSLNIPPICTPDKENTETDSAMSSVNLHEDTISETHTDEDTNENRDAHSLNARFSGMRKSIRKKVASTSRNIKAQFKDGDIANQSVARETQPSSQTESPTNKASATSEMQSIDEENEHHDANTLNARFTGLRKSIQKQVVTTSRSIKSQFTDGDSGNQSATRESPSSGQSPVARGSSADETYVDNAHLQAQALDDGNENKDPQSLNARFTGLRKSIRKKVETTSRSIKSQFSDGDNQSATPRKSHSSSQSSVAERCENDGANSETLSDNVMSATKDPKSLNARYSGMKKSVQITDGDSGNQSEIRESPSSNQAPVARAYSAEGNVVNANLQAQSMKEGNDSKDPQSLNARFTGLRKSIRKKVETTSRSIKSQFSDGDNQPATPRKSHSSSQSIAERSENDGANSETKSDNATSAMKDPKSLNARFSGMKKSVQKKVVTTSRSLKSHLTLDSTRRNDDSITEAVKYESDKESVDLNRQMSPDSENISIIIPGNDGLPVKYSENISVSIPENDGSPVKNSGNISVTIDENDGKNEQSDTASSHTSSQIPDTGRSKNDTGISEDTRSTSSTSPTSSHTPISERSQSELDDQESMTSSSTSLSTCVSDKTETQEVEKTSDEKVSRVTKARQNIKGMNKRVKRSVSLKTKSFKSSVSRRVKARPSFNTVLNDALKKAGLNQTDTRNLNQELHVNSPSQVQSASKNSEPRPSTSVELSLSGINENSLDATMDSNVPISEYTDSESMDLSSDTDIDIVEPSKSQKKDGLTKKIRRSVSQRTKSVKLPFPKRPVKLSHNFHEMLTQALQQATNDTSTENTELDPSTSGNVKSATKTSQPMPLNGHEDGLSENSRIGSNVDYISNKSEAKSIDRSQNRDNKQVDENINKQDVECMQAPVKPPRLKNSPDNAGPEDDTQNTGVKGLKTRIRRNVSLKTPSVKLPFKVTRRRKTRQSFNAMLKEALAQSAEASESSNIPLAIPIEAQYIQTTPGTSDIKTKTSVNRSFSENDKTEAVASSSSSLSTCSSDKTEKEAKNETENQEKQNTSSSKVSGKKGIRNRIRRTVSNKTKPVNLPFARRRIKKRDISDPVLIKDDAALESKLPGWNLAGTGYKPKSRTTTTSSFTSVSDFDLTQSTVSSIKSLDSNRNRLESDRLSDKEANVEDNSANKQHLNFDLAIEDKPALEQKDKAVEEPENINTPTENKTGLKQSLMRMTSSPITSPFSRSSSNNNTKSSTKKRHRKDLRSTITQTLAQVAGAPLANVNIAPNVPLHKSASYSGQPSEHMYSVEPDEINHGNGGISSTGNSSNGDSIGAPESDHSMREMRKSSSFERQPFEGLLYKYTNVVKGWQYRWFVLDPRTGRLEYFEKEEYKKQKARGVLHLAGAQIYPSDEDEQTFSINAANGELYRLRATDAKERQHWVTRLRSTAEYQTDLLLQTQGGTLPWERTHSPQGSVESLTRSQESLRKLKAGKSRMTSSENSQQKGARKRSPVVVTRRSQHKTLPPAVINSTQQLAAQGQFSDVKDMLGQVNNQHATLSYRIEDLPGNEKELLLLKATSAATLACLESCLSILQQQTAESLNYGETASRSTFFVPRNGAQSSPSGSFRSAHSYPTATASDTSLSYTTHDSFTRLSHADEVEDLQSYSDTDLQEVEQHKSVILHLLSQLKLGMDLTKVVLPTFILEKRSLLELFADCMAHPDLFLRIPDQQDPAERMLAVVQWYLTSFHAGRQGSQAKKPYNPIIGEHFHCSWQRRKQQKSADQSNKTSTTTDQSESPTNNQSGTSQQNGELRQTEPEQNGKISNNPDNEDLNFDPEHFKDKKKAKAQSQGQTGVADLYYCAEQVSHHPPISAIYYESPSKQMYMEGSIWTRSKFLGMSIGVVMVGKVYMHLLSHNDETYEFTLPSAYARSILTVPWVELGDKVTINCPQTGYSANIIFHTKPFYGGRLHRVTCEVKSGTEVISRAQGEWDQEFTFTNTAGESNEVLVDDLEIRHKWVRPVSMQSEFESRRLWSDVTQALEQNNEDQATEHKRFLEERQRQGERHRRESNTQYPTKFFHKSGDRWMFNNPLKPGQTDPSL